MSTSNQDENERKQQSANKQYHEMKDKRLKDWRKFEDDKRAEEAMWLGSLPEEAQGAVPGPKPMVPTIKNFLASLQGPEKEACHYDESRGVLKFKINENGAAALKKFFDQNPNAKFHGEGFKDKDEAKAALNILKDKGIDIKSKLGSIEIGGEVYSGKRLDELLEKMYAKPKPRF